jgi:CRP/FNR family transcriptional regulator
MNGLLFRRRSVRAGEVLYAQGERFHTLYSVRSGTLKSSLVLAQGREYITGFHITGDAVGLDAVASSVHASTALALEDTEVYGIAYARFAELAAADAEVQRMLVRLMSQTIVREQGFLMLLGVLNAEERLAAFLISLSTRLHARGYAAHEFHLKMSRMELSNHIGISVETASRMLTGLQQRGLLHVDRRHICITNPEGLLRASGSGGSHTTAPAPQPARAGASRLAGYAETQAS